MSDEYDGLHLCEVCGDVETLGTICHRCQEQQQIDRGIGLPDSVPPDDRYYWLDFDFDDPDECDILGHDWFDGYCAYCGAPEPDRTRG